MTASTGVPLFYLHIARAELEARFGSPTAVDLDSNGVGLFDAWVVRCPCGLEIAAWWFHDVGDAPNNVEIHANERDEGHILLHLGEVGAQTSHCTPDACPPAPPRWIVMRADDNGNQFEVARYGSYCEAAHVAGVFESRGHKQVYWVAERPHRDG